MIIIIIEFITLADLEAPSQFMCCPSTEKLWSTPKEWGEAGGTNGDMFPRDKQSGLKLINLVYATSSEYFWRNVLTSFLKRVRCIGEDGLKNVEKHIMHTKYVHLMSIFLLSHLFLKKFDSVHIASCIDQVKSQSELLMRVNCIFFAMLSYPHEPQKKAS